MKTAIVLTGRHEVTDDRYKNIVSAFRDAGRGRTELYSPNWKRTTVGGLVNDFLQIVPKDDQPLSMLGFSLGAMIALIASTSLEVENLILCSPSGYFKEYMPLLTQEDLVWARQYLSDFEAYTARTVIESTNVRHGFIIAGEKELAKWHDFKQWVDDLKQQTGWRYVKLANVDHEIEDVNYQRNIQLLIESLG
jgi:pimeloyl-ACP methyl ester carboxylesterase